eukprot:TRINITY_DN1498_c0_g1_i6.p2 TRINITY_DN1498_c0_g1~~TRINITY_DN1498_c0_g1_i6.p2  ORF type:complete len:311 (-),score=89.73 TRINITY_DN1498_c0_g1_i6:70-891(-)
MRMLGQIMSNPSLMVLSDTNRFLQACLVLLYFIHPTLVNTTLSIFPCVSVGQRSFLAADMSIDCESSTYLSWRAFGGVYLALYCFGALAAIGGFLHRHRDDLADASTAAWEHFRYLLNGYNTKFRFFYLWDIVVTLRKMLIVTFAAFFSAPLQVFFGSLVLYASFMTALRHEPLADIPHQRMELASLQLLFVTALTGLLYLTDVFVGQNGAGTTIAVLLILLNSAFVLTVFVRAVYIVLSTSATVQRRMSGAIKSLRSSRKSGSPAAVEMPSF